MKKSFALAVAVLAIVVTVQAQDTPLPIFRGPPISSSLSSNMSVWEGIAKSQAYPKNLIKMEGEESDQWSSGQGAEDYFVVYIPNLPDHGTILTMRPIRRLLDGSLPLARFTDVINGRATYDAILDPQTLSGSFTIAGEKIWVKIDYHGTLYNPQAQLTWGDNAGPGDIGSVFDDFRFAVSDQGLPPSEDRMAIVNMVGVTDVPDGIYVAVNTRDERYTLESTTDFKSWSVEPKPFYILGYIALHHYEKAGVSGNKFFRTKR